LMSREETIKLADSYVSQGFLCSESCLMALAKCQGVESPLVPRIATGFGAGIGRSGEICGAITGAVMGLGIKYGRDRVDPAGNQKPYWYSAELLKRFRAMYGETRCPALLGLDLAKAEDLEEYRRRNLWVNRCTGFILSATGLARDIIEENG
jgi:C_GCAxxG_C_C family probable redox protein